MISLPSLLFYDWKRSCWFDLVILKKGLHWVDSNLLVRCLRFGIWMDDHIFMLGNSLDIWLTVLRHRRRVAACCGHGLLLIFKDHHATFFDLLLFSGKLSRLSNFWVIAVNVVLSSVHGSCRCCSVSGCWVTFSR